jgi:hypothetical protein
MKQTIDEMASDLRVVVEGYRERLQHLGVDIEPKAIDPKKTVGTCTLPELVAHLLHLFVQFDAINVALHPRQAHNHLRCIGTCLDCMPQ